MLTAPQIIQTEVQHAAVIHLTIPRHEMMRVFGPACRQSGAHGIQRSLRRPACGLG